jgi:hypothetical protein
MLLENKNYFTLPKLHQIISSRGHDQRSYLKWPILRYQTAVVEKECVQQVTNTVTNLLIFVPLVIEADVAPAETP